MNFNEIQNILNEKTGCKVSQSDIAQVLKVTRQNINKRLKNNSELSFNEILEIENYYNISIVNNNFSKENQNDNFNKILKLKYYKNLSLNNNDDKLKLNETKYFISVPLCSISDYSSEKEYIVVNSNTDSMEPVIKSNDLLIIELTNTEQLIEDNSIYVFCYNEQFFIKRLIKNINELIIKPENLNSYYKIEVINNKDINKVQIIGKIRGLIRKF